MRFSLFYHSLVSDWNHGNAHFLRGVVRELSRRGHRVTVFEPKDGWSRTQLLEHVGDAALRDFHAAFPDLSSTLYTQDDLDLEAVADASDVVLVHEWNEPWLVNQWAALRQSPRARFKLLFHDTHHRAVSEPSALARFRLAPYDGVLAFGEVLRKAYKYRGWAELVSTWHEAADTSTFSPRPAPAARDDLVWIGNWGDEERSAELEEFLLHPVRTLGLRATIYGVRYPEPILKRLARDGIRYGGWLPNFRVPDVFAQHRVTVHVPRRFYREALAGIPTIRPFEAMASGIPLVSASWDDVEGLFRAGRDYLVAKDGDEMVRHLRRVLSDPALAESLSQHGLQTVRARHTCAHRVEQLLSICRDGLGLASRASERAPHEERRSP